MDIREALSGPYPTSETLLAGLKLRNITNTKIRMNRLRMSLDSSVVLTSLTCATESLLPERQGSLKLLSKDLSVD